MSGAEKHAELDRLLAVVERAASYDCVRPLVDCRPGARCLPCMAREALGRAAHENPLPHGSSL